MIFIPQIDFLYRAFEVINDTSLIGEVVLSKVLHERWGAYQGEHGNHIPILFRNAIIKKAKHDCNRKLVLMRLNLAHGEVWRVINLDVNYSFGITNIEGSAWGKYLQHESKKNTDGHTEKSN